MWRRLARAAHRHDAVPAALERCTDVNARRAQVWLLAAVPRRTERGEPAHAHRKGGLDRTYGDDGVCRTRNADRHLFGVVPDELGGRGVIALDPSVDVARAANRNGLDHQCPLFGEAHRTPGGELNPQELVTVVDVCGNQLDPILPRSPEEALGHRMSTIDQGRVLPFRGLELEPVVVGRVPPEFHIDRARPTRRASPDELVGPTLRHGELCVASFEPLIARRLDHDPASPPPATAELVEADLK